MRAPASGAVRGDSRKLTGGSAAINYRLYSEPTRSTVWGNTVSTDTGLRHRKRRGTELHWSMAAFRREDDTSPGHLWRYDPPSPSPTERDCQDRQRRTAVAHKLQARWITTRSILW